MVYIYCLDNTHFLSILPDVGISEHIVKLIWKPEVKAKVIHTRKKIFQCKIYNELVICQVLYLVRILRTLHQQKESVFILLGV